MNLINLSKFTLSFLAKVN